MELAESAEISGDQWKYIGDQWTELDLTWLMDGFENRDKRSS